MRISDWSSDVCSSDLFAARKFGIGLGELEPEGHGFGVDAMAAADRRGQLVLMGAALDRIEQRVEVGEQYVGGLAELDREAGVEHVARSEEHTSELQSLMRISYAVFCLKKKTLVDNRLANHVNRD